MALTRSDALTDPRLPTPQMKPWIQKGKKNTIFPNLSAGGVLLHVRAEALPGPAATDPAHRGLLADAQVRPVPSALALSSLLGSSLFDGNTHGAPPTPAGSTTC